MSHFTVAVVLPEYSEESLKEALQPYHEYECTGIKDQYVVKTEVDEYSMEEYKTKTIPCVVGIRDGIFFGTRYGDAVSPFWKRNGAGFSSQDELKLPSYLVEKDLPATEVYSTYEEYLKDWCGIDVTDEDSSYTLENGKLYTLTNPNAKWDWWQIGGRWSGHFNIKPEEYDPNLPVNNKDEPKRGDRSWTNKDEIIRGYDVIRKGDIDLETGFQEKFEEKLKHFETYLDVVKQYPEYETWGELTKEVFTENVREKYWSQPILVELKERLKKEFPDQYEWESPTPETFCKGDYSAYKNKIRYQTFGTYAILKDKEWMQKGEMGWFGCDSNVDTDWETKWFEIFNSIPDDHWVVLVDCHI